ncbi:MAG: rhomboid family intramembrane serine protease [Cyanobacteria bacterium P01_G01_bin.67]
MSSYYRKPVKQSTVLKEFKILIVSIAVFWIVEILDFLVFQGSLDGYGVRPQSIIGLRGIVFAPFLHGGFGHLMANTVPFLTLGWLTMIQETKDFYIATIMSALIGGLGVWVFGSPNSVHIGASILIYGYLGFLLLRGYFQKNFPSIALSIFVAIAYGSFIWGVFPSQLGISWQGHLFGFVGGAIAAKMVAQEKK